MRSLATDYYRPKEAFLKLGKRPDLVVREFYTLRRYNQLIIVIIQPVQHGDAPAFVLEHRLEYPQHIGVQLLSIRG